MNYYTDFYELLNQAYIREKKNICELSGSENTIPLLAGIVDTYDSIISELEISKVYFQGDIVSARDIFKDNDIEVVTKYLYQPFFDYKAILQMNPLIRMYE